MSPISVAIVARVMGALLLLGVGQLAATLTSVMTTGSVGISASAASAIASAVSMPLATAPMIW